MRSSPLFLRLYGDRGYIDPASGKSHPAILDPVVWTERDILLFEPRALRGWGVWSQEDGVWAMPRPETFWVQSLGGHLGAVVFNRVDITDADGKVIVADILQGAEYGSTNMVKIEGLKIGLAFDRVPA